MATPAVAPTHKPSGFGVWLQRILGSLPVVVGGIEQLHGDSVSGANKKKMALDALGLGIDATESIDPALTPAIIAATELVSVAIDGVKNIYNAVKAKPGTVAPPALPSVASFQTPSQS